MRTDHPPLTILGAGYVGGRLWQRLAQAQATRRRPGEAGVLRFDLADEATWDTPSFEDRHVVWTFPALPLDAVRRFHAARLRGARSLIVLGSTSAWPVADHGVVDIDEGDVPDLTIPRVQGEEWLRERGATVLRLAGIFGPDREPADWLRRGRIRDGAKIVNLIHVDDIVDLIARLLEHPAPGMLVNVANGEPLAWRDLAARLRIDLPDEGGPIHGKRIANGRLRGLLPGHEFRRPGA